MGFSRPHRVVSQRISPRQAFGRDPLSPRVAFGAGAHLLWGRAPASPTTTSPRVWFADACASHAPLRRGRSRSPSVADDAIPMTYTASRKERCISRATLGRPLIAHLDRHDTRYATRGPFSPPTAPMVNVSVGDLMRASAYVRPCSYAPRRPLQLQRPQPDAHQSLPNLALPNGPQLSSASCCAALISFPHFGYPRLAGFGFGFW